MSCSPKSPRVPRIDQKILLALHDARTAQELAPVLFAFVGKMVKQELMYLMMKPGEFELRSYSSRIEYQYLGTYYDRVGHHEDIWLARSPKDPTVPVVVHSRYTPQALLRQSGFYREVMQRIGCEYGVSLVAWQGATWLSCLTLFRTQAQGDFLASEEPVLGYCQREFQSIVRRIASLNEEKITILGLEGFIWKLSAPTVVLNWQLKPTSWSAEGQEIAREWKEGVRMTATKRSGPVDMPADILAAIEERRATLLEDKPGSPDAPREIPLGAVSHRTNRELSAEMTFMPSKRLTLTKGTFLVQFRRRQPIPTAEERKQMLELLSRREREVVLLTAGGSAIKKIAKRFGTSPKTVSTQLNRAYRKINIHDRFQIIAIFRAEAIADPDEPAPQ